MNENARNSGMSVVNSKNANQNIQNRVKKYLHFSPDEQKIVHPYFYPGWPLVRTAPRSDGTTPADHKFI